MATKTITPTSRRSSDERRSIGRWSRASGPVLPGRAGSSTTPSPAPPAVPGAHDGLDAIETRLNGLELATKATHVGIDDALGHDRFITTDDVKESIARQHDTGPARQSFEESELGKGDCEKLASVPRFDALRVEHE